IAFLLMYEKSVRSLRGIYAEAKHNIVGGKYSVELSRTIRNFVEEKTPRKAFFQSSILIFHN
ncbi:MAG: hypothetical protein K2K12_03310, partial [Clostridia bacterium]|nr:hypothetical protein [Clostridia bacterium]